MKILTPKRLKKGDTIGLISPSSPMLDSEKLDRSISYFERNGYNVKLGKSIAKETGYLAGSDQERLDDLHSMFSDKDVNAIFAIRGGYGAIRIIDKLNYELIRKNPKIFVGFSDITILQLAIFQKSQLITFAGPMVNTYFGSEELNDYVEEQLWNLLTNSKKVGKIKNPNSEKIFVLNKGRGEGKLLGGNLSSMLSLSGTEYLPTFRNSILFLEEINEPPYKIDRMFNQLKLQKIINNAKGIILGRFVDCYEQDTTKKSLSLNDIIIEYFQGIKKPVIYNLKHGHIKQNITLPVGANCKLNGSRGFFEITQSVVS